MSTYRIAKPRSRILLVSCGSQKEAKRCEARKLYRGVLTRARIAYAEAQGCLWWIVSAGHGLVHPDQLLSPYEATLDPKPSVEKSGWALRVALDLVSELSDNAKLREISVEFHAGERYCDPLEDVLRGAGFSTARPVRGLGIGEQKAWYAQRLKQRTV